MALRSTKLESHGTEGTSAVNNLGEYNDKKIAVQLYHIN